MLQKLFYIPVALWLLLPPGLCLSTINRMLGLAPSCFRDPKIAAIEEGEDDHSPSCPCKKSAFTTRATAEPTIHFAALPLALELSLASDPTASSAHIKIYPILESCRHETERYLSLRTLQI